MEEKKKPELQAEDLKTKFVYTLSGIILILGITLCFLEYKSINDSKIHLYSSLITLEDEHVLEITSKVLIPPPPVNPLLPPEHVKVVKNAPNLVNSKPIIQDTFKYEPFLTDELIDPDTMPKIDPIFEVVEQDPMFPGGMSKLYEYLSKSIYYPDIAKKNGIQGKVFIQFIINKDGSIDEIKVIKGVHSSINKEAIKVVKQMPKWIPGEQRGEKVKVRFTLPIKFKLG